MITFNPTTLSLDFVNNVGVINGEDYSLDPSRTAGRTNAFTNGNITFSRGPNAMVTDNTGRLTYALNNLCSTSEFPNGVIDAPTRGGLLTATTFAGLNSNTGLAFGYDGVTGTYAYKTGLVVAGTTYIFSVYVRMDDGAAPTFGASDGSSGLNSFAIIIGGSLPNPLTYNVQFVSPGLYRVSGVLTISSVSVNTTGIVKYASNNNRTFKLSGYQLEAVTYQTTPSTYTWTTTTAYYGPRFDYDPVTLQPRGLLIEESRTNLMLNSTSFSTNWTTYGAGNGEVLSSISGPDGTSSMIGLNDTSTIGYYGRSTGVNSLAANTYTFSAYVKQGTSTAGFSLWIFNSTLSTWIFQGTLSWVGGVPTATGWTSTNVGNGIYRVSYTFTLSDIYSVIVYMLPTITSTSATGSTYFYGPQLEAGSFATSYIPTAASIVTRNADVCTISGSNFTSWFRPTEGTYTIAYTQGSGTTARAALVASNNTTNNRIALFADGSNDLTTQPVYAVITNGISQASQTFTAAAQNATHKMAAAYGLTSFAGSVDGSTPSTTLTGAVPAVTQLSVGNQNGTTQLNGYIRSLQYYPMRLPDSILQSLTT